MIKIVYPPYQPRIKNDAGKEFIFDSFTALTGTPKLQDRCPHRPARMVRLQLKKWKITCVKNEVNSPNHVHLMWQVDYTFSGGILTQAVFGGGHPAKEAKVVTKKVENNQRKNEVNLPNNVHPMWQVDYTFSGGILTQECSVGAPTTEAKAKNTLHLFL